MLLLMLKWWDLYYFLLLKMTKGKELIKKMCTSLRKNRISSFCDKFVTNRSPSQQCSNFGLWCTDFRVNQSLFESNQNTKITFGWNNIGEKNKYKNYQQFVTSEYLDFVTGYRCQFNSLHQRVVWFFFLSKGRL